MMKKILSIILLTLVLGQQAPAQSGLFPAWTVLGNPSASAALSQSATITQMLDGAFANTANGVLSRGASAWGSTIIGTNTFAGNNGSGFAALTVAQGKTLFGGLAISPTDPTYGAKCDGSTDDATAINAALTAAAGGMMVFPVGVNCKVNSQLSIPANTKVIGYGATITKGASIDMITMAGGSWLEGLILAGVGGSFTGAAVVITAGNDQKLFSVQCSNFVGFCVDVNNDVGLRLAIVNGFYQRTTVTNPAIRFAGSGGQETNGDRVVAFVFCGGSWLIDTAGSQNTLLHGNDCINFTSGANSAKTVVSGNRWATLGSDLTLNGTQHNVTGNIIAGGITLASGLQNTTIGPNTLAVGSTITDSSGQTNNRYYKEATWTPTLIGSTGGGPVTYTTQVGSYEINNRQVTVRFVLGISALNAITGNAQIGGLPFASGNVAGDSGQCSFSDWGAITLTASYTFLGGSIAANTSVVRMFQSGSAQSVAALTVAGLSNTSNLEGVCIYHF